MLDISSYYRNHIFDHDRETSVTIQLFLPDDTGELVSHTLHEDDIVENSLTIVDQINNGKFGFGSVYVKNMSVKIDCDSANLEAININLTGAQVRVWFALEDERLELGTFWVDENRCNRRGNILSIYAVDVLSKLDIESTAILQTKPYQVYVTACNLAGVVAATTEEEYYAMAGMDNWNDNQSIQYYVNVAVDVSRVQTARDMLMWAADFAHANAKSTHVDTESGGRQRAIKLVQYSTKYTGTIPEGETKINGFWLDGFRADDGAIIPPEARFKTEAGDSYICVDDVWHYDKDGDLLHFTDSLYAYTDREMFAQYEQPQNPIVFDQDKTINIPKIPGYDAQIMPCRDLAISEYTFNIWRYLQTKIRFVPFKTTFMGDPSIECGDWVVLESGGDIDDEDILHYGMVTYSKWTYPNKHEIRCQSDLKAQRHNQTQSAARIANAEAGIATIAETTTADPRGLNTKSQLEKRVDGLNSLSAPRNNPYNAVHSELKVINSGDMPYPLENGGPMRLAQGNTLYLSTSGSAVYAAARGADMTSPNTLALTLQSGNMWIETMSYGNVVRFEISSSGIKYSYKTASDPSSERSVYIQPQYDGFSVTSRTQDGTYPVLRASTTSGVMWNGQQLAYKSDIPSSGGGGGGGGGGETTLADRARILQTNTSAPALVATGERSTNNAALTTQGEFHIKTATPNSGTETTDSLINSAIDLFRWQSKRVGYTSIPDFSREGVHRFSEFAIDTRTGQATVDDNFYADFGMYCYESYELSKTNLDAHEYKNASMFVNANIGTTTPPRVSASKWSGFSTNTIGENALGSSFGENSVYGNVRSLYGGGIHFYANEDCTSLIVEVAGELNNLGIFTTMTAEIQLHSAGATGISQDPTTKIADVEKVAKADTTENDGANVTYSDDGIHIEYKGHTKFIPWD